MNPIITATAENLDTLTATDKAQVELAAEALTIAGTINAGVTLDHVETGLRVAFPGAFIYRGGSHVALHLGPAKERVLLVTERRPEPEPVKPGWNDWKALPAYIQSVKDKAEALQACTGAVSVTVTDGDQTATVAVSEAAQAMIDGTYDQKGPVLPAIVAEPGYGRYTFYADRRSSGQPEPYKARIEAKAETINALHLTDLTALRQTLRQEFPGFKFEQEPGLLIMSRPLSNSPSLVCSQPLTCAEANIRPGQTFDIHVNQGNREAEVLAVDGRRYLVEYTMPKGTTALQVFTVGIIGGKSVSYTGLTIAWLQALVAADRGWVANPQKGPFGTIPSPAEQLAAKKGGR